MITEDDFLKAIEEIERQTAALEEVFIDDDSDEDADAGMRPRIARERPVILPVEASKKAGWGVPRSQSASLTNAAERRGDA